MADINIDSSQCHSLVVKDKYGVVGHLNVLSDNDAAVLKQAQKDIADLQTRIASIRLDRFLVSVNEPSDAEDGDIWVKPKIVTLTFPDTTIYANQFYKLVIYRSDGEAGTDPILLKLTDSYGYYHTDLVFNYSSTDGGYKYYGSYKNGELVGGTDIQLGGECHFELLSDGYKTDFGKLTILPIVEGITDGTPRVILPTIIKTEMTYNYAEQTFAKAGSTTRGTMLYALASFNPDEETYEEARADWVNRLVVGWSTKVPTAKNAGSYIPLVYVSSANKTTIYNPATGEVMEAMRYCEAVNFLNVAGFTGGDYVTIKKKVIS